MIAIWYDGIKLEWVVQYRLEGTPVRTVRTVSPDLRDEIAKDMLRHEKAVACGAKFAYGVTQS